MHNYVSGNIILQTCLSQDSTWKNKLPQLTDLLDSADKLFVSNLAEKCIWIILIHIKNTYKKNH